MLYDYLRVCTASLLFGILQQPPMYQVRWPQSRGWLMKGLEEGEQRAEKGRRWQNRGGLGRMGGDGTGRRADQAQERVG